jgi:hypothetical protein
LAVVLFAAAAVVMGVTSRLSTQLDDGEGREQG